MKTDASIIVGRYSAPITLDAKDGESAQELAHRFAAELSRLRRIEEAAHAVADVYAISNGESKALAALRAALAGKE